MKLFPVYDRMIAIRHYAEHISVSVDELNTLVDMLNDHGIAHAITEPISPKHDDEIACLMYESVDELDLELIYALWLHRVCKMDTHRVCKAILKIGVRFGFDDSEYEIEEV